jgi:DNA-binding protein Fis
LNALYEHDGEAAVGEVLHHEETPLSKKIIEAAQGEDSREAVIDNVKTDRDALAKSLAKLDEWIAKESAT